MQIFILDGVDKKGKKQKLRLKKWVIVLDSKHKQFER